MKITSIHNDNVKYWVSLKNKKIRDKENQAKREEEQSNFGAEENTVWDRLEVQNEELVAAVQQLKPKARFIVTGYVLKGKTFKELAQETKLTERAAASTYYRSIEKLRIKMEKEKCYVSTNRVCEKRMSYVDYKIEYISCRTKEGSYDGKNKTIVVYVPYDF